MVIESFLGWMGSAPAAKRVQAASALARAYLTVALSEREKADAEAAMTLLLDDPCTQVREALAVALASHPAAPANVIRGLAADTHEIAVLILANSPVFTDSELVDLAAGGTAEQQIAIACRARVSVAVCAAIGEVGIEDACLGLLANPGARPTSSTLTRIAERFGHDAEIRSALFACPQLPADVRMMLVERLGAALDNLVTSRNWITPQRSASAVREACERTAVALVASAEEDQVDRLIRSLIEQGRMTTAFLLRAICMGNITLFARSLSALSDLPVARVEAVISRDHHTALKAIYRRSGMPEAAFDVFAGALAAWRRVLRDGGQPDRSRLPYLVTREVSARYASAGGNALVDELLVLLAKLSADAAREDARLHVSQVMAKRQNPVLEEPADDPIEIDEFERELEQSMAELFAEGVIDIDPASMRGPVQPVANTPIARDEAETAEILSEEAVYSNAA